MAVTYQRDFHLWSRDVDSLCPSGGNWYACETGPRFVGCCAGNVDPCSTTTGCPKKNVKPASFNASLYGTFSDQECSAGGQWYTCTGTDPPFMGCCKSNPCAAKGCPAGNLTAGSLSTDPDTAAPFLNASTSLLVPTASATPSSSTSDSITSGDNVAAIVGIAIGGAAGLGLVLIASLWWCKRVRNRKRVGEANNAESASRGIGEHDAEQDSDKPPQTSYSQEEHDGLEVNSRPEGTFNDGRVRSFSRPLPRSRPQSNLLGWPDRASMVHIDRPSPQHQRGEGSHISRDLHSQQASVTHASMLSPGSGYPSPVGTPTRGSFDQADYFSHRSPLRRSGVSYELSADERQRHIGHSPLSPQWPLSTPEYYELADTQTSPPVELEATEVRDKSREGSAEPEVVERATAVDRFPFSPDEVGSRPGSRNGHRANSVYEGHSHGFVGISQPLRSGGLRPHSLIESRRPHSLYGGRPSRNVIASHLHEGPGRPRSWVE